MFHFFFLLCIEHASARELLHPVPVTLTLKLKTAMLVFIDDETVSVSVALTEAPAAKL